MLFKTPVDFFEYVKKVKQNSCEEEAILYANIEENKEKIKESYLPVLAMYLKRYFKEPSLEVIYRGISVLETSIDSFNFQNEDLNFTKFLGIKIKQMVASYIADK
jgi:hypothetical protein